MNAAFSQSRGAFIIRVDARTRIEPDYILRCVEILEREGVEVVGGRQIPRGRGPVGRAAALLSASYLGSGGAAYRREEEAARSEPREVDTVYLGAWPRRVFDSLGGFDESLLQNQDEEFCFRIRRHGGRVLLSDSIKSSYEVRESLRGIGQQYFRFGLFKPWVLLRHPNETRWRHLIPPAVVGGALIGSVASLSWPAASMAMTLLFLLWLGLHVGLALRARGEGTWIHRGLLPLVALIQQVAYGSGFLLGLVRSAAAPSPRIPRVSKEGEIARQKALYRARDERLGGRYDACRPEVRNERDWRRRELAELFDAVELKNLGALRILEVGMGRGDFAGDLLALGADRDAYHGVDLLPERLLIARELQGLRRIALASGDALPFADENFDLVVFATVLSSVRNEPLRNAMIEECDRVLRPSGMTLVYDLIRKAPGRDWRPVEKAELRRIWGPPIAEKKFGLAPGVWRVLSPLSPRLVRRFAKTALKSSHALFLFRKSA